MGSQLEPLQFAARKGGERLVQVEILQPHIDQRAEFLLDEGAGEEAGGQADRQVHRLGDV